jgi:hypothetical protein
MWVLEAVHEVPIRKPFLVLLITLGAAFLLLAKFFGLNPVYQPAIYAVVALDLYLLERQKSLLRGCLLIPAAYFLAYALLPAYLPLFAVAYALLIGKLVYAESFRLWKWAATTLLIAASLLIVSVWQQIAFVNQFVPFQLSPALHGALFAFCFLCAFLPYHLKKDSVADAIASYSWKRPSEIATIVEQTEWLYNKLRTQIPTKPNQAELTEFCERLIHLCYRLQEIQKEVAGVDLGSLQQQIYELEQKAQRVSDAMARKQYEHALSNKRTQLRQHDALRNQSERIRAQILNYVSALENMQFAYANQRFSSSSDSTESIDFFLHMANNRAENVYETSEAYQKLLSE